MPFLQAQNGKLCSHGNASAGDCHGKEGKVLALASHCFKVQGHPGLVAFLGPAHLIKSPAFKEKRGEGGEAEEDEEDEEEETFFSGAGGKYKAGEMRTTRCCRFVQFITDVKGEWARPAAAVRQLPGQG